jgi:hypothetical protein
VEAAVGLVLPNRPNNQGEIYMKFTKIYLGAALSTTLSIGLIASAQAQNSISAFVAVNAATPSGFVPTGTSTGNGVLTDSNSFEFTGLDGSGNIQTMTYDGTAMAQSNYGRLKAKATGSVTNAYYNSENSSYTDQYGFVIDPNGSPFGLISFGKAIFNDTLQFGGNLQSGYKAHYIFHVDGTISDTSDLVSSRGFTTLQVKADNNPEQVFSYRDLGFVSTDWVTNNFAVNGTTPQNINIGFAAGTYFDLSNLPQGFNYSGASDFSATLNLATIEVVDQDGNLASGWTVSSASGTIYPTNSGVSAPEPNTIALLCLGGVGMLKRPHKKSKRSAFLC